MNDPLLIKRLKAGLKSDETGNKANSLIFLHRYGFNIPVTWLVTTKAHELYLERGITALDDLRKDVARLPEFNYAIRSSTNAEDARDFSFAGQFQTLINIQGTEDILKAIQKVWDSASLLNNNEYLRRTGVSTVKCAVIIQEMISSKLAGVSFSRNPVTNQDEIVIEAVEGYGEDLVQKGKSPFRWRFRNDMIIEGKTEYPYLPEIWKVAKDTLKLKKYYGNNIDIEWVFDGKKIYYLQLRQITGNQYINIYSNKMAREMLPGQIKPLVWSVNIPLVNGTWIRILSEITGQLDVKPEDLAKPFYYQTYFNIAKLGRIFSKFGMSANSLEMLMLSDDNQKPAFKPGPGILKHTFRIVRFIRHKLNFEKIYLRDFEILSADFRKIKEHLKNDHNASSFQETYSMLFDKCGKLAYLNIVIPLLMSFYHRRLKKQLAKLKLDYNNLDFRHDFPLLANYTPIISMQRIRRQIEDLPDNIRENCITLEKLRSFDEAANIVKGIDDFLKEFGHLSESGNDFSFAKWEEDRELVFRMIRRSSAEESGARMYTLDELSNNGTRLRPSMLRIYRKAGRFKVYREQISSLYIYGYGLFRTLFVNLGKEFTSMGIIDSANDIFYLGKEEIDIIIKNIEMSELSRYQDLVNKRRAEMNDTKDFVLPQVIYGENAPILERDRAKNHFGISTSSGSYCGKTKVIRTADDFDSVETGDVLLIPFSDVSWTPILVKAGAIVSETGGLLSHCSIIAREMGIPALVSVENACSIGNGLSVTVDGSNGILTIHDHE